MTIVRIKPVGSFDPRTDIASNRVLTNSSWGGGSIVVFRDDVVHLCPKAKRDGKVSVSKGGLSACPRKCGTVFDPRAWVKTREIHQI